jgi:hypothetical protein
MDACVTCGARLAPEIAWCGQCFTPVGAPPAPTSVRRPFRPGTTPPRPQVSVPVEYSRWKSGATSMGWMGRALATIGLLVLAVAVYFYVFVVTVGVTGPQTVLVYVLMVAPVVLYLLSKVWRPVRIR